jgi:hypothetical protein
MSFAHLTLPTRDVTRTAALLEHAFAYGRKPVPDNSPVEVVWFDVGHGQEIHVMYVDGFDVSPFEDEFGRHVAVCYPLAGFPALKERLVAAGATFIEPLRTTPFERFFFREPVNGYVFEVIAEGRPPRSQAR